MTMLICRAMIILCVAQLVATAAERRSGMTPEDRVVEALAEMAAYRAGTEDAVRVVKHSQTSRSGQFAALQSRYTAAAYAFSAYLEALARAGEDPSKKLEAVDAAAVAEQAQGLLENTLATVRGDRGKGFEIALPALVHLVMHVLDLPSKSKERKNLRDLLSDSRWQAWEDIQ